MYNRIFRSFSSKKATKLSKYYLSTDASSLSDKAFFPGYKGDFTTKLEILFPETNAKIPEYRVLDRNGAVMEPSEDPQLDAPTLIKMYKTMFLLNKFDTLMQEAQRQNRITFYLASQGEGAVHVGTAAALDNQDLLFCQYREAGALLWRDYSIQDCCHQIVGNALGSCRGRQASVHYGSKKYNYVTVSDTIGTQVPQAVGAAYAFKRNHNGLVVATYFGDGGSSTGDVHVGMNFATVFDVPLIFICRNNRFAISTPTRDQYRSDGIAARGPGYGIASIRVDGNDIFAVYNATKKAREIALNESRPVLIEAMTYRSSHHSTSDDSTVYRSVNEMNVWGKDNDPIVRFKKYLVHNKLWDQSHDEALDDEYHKLIVSSFSKAEEAKLPSPVDMFMDVYDQPTPQLKRQMDKFKKHLKSYKNQYPLENFEKF